MVGEGIRAALGCRLARTRFGREALEGQADLSALRTRPTPKARLGLGLVALSYVIGWPAVGVLAAVAYRLREPLIVVVGGPLTYGLSHVVFMAGCWLAGAHYVRVLLHWTVRKAIEKLGAAEGSPGGVATKKIDDGGR